jgi:Flp pilus assembly protein CpaB
MSGTSSVRICSIADMNGRHRLLFGIGFALIAGNFVSSTSDPRDITPAPVPPVVPLLSPQGEEIAVLLRGRKALGARISKEVYDALIQQPSPVDVHLTVTDPAGTSNRHTLLENVPVLAIDYQVSRDDQEFVTHAYVVTMAVKACDVLKVHIARLMGDVTAVPHREGDGNQSR